MIKDTARWLIVNILLTFGLYSAHGTVDWSDWLNFIVAITAASWLAFVSVTVVELWKHLNLSMAKDIQRRK